jgi:hypothetical protein
MLPRQWAPAVEGPFLVVVTLVLSYAGHEGVRRLEFYALGWVCAVLTQARPAQNLTMQIRKTRPALSQTARYHRAVDLAGAVVDAGDSGVAVVALYG